MNTLVTNNTNANTLLATKALNDQRAIIADLEAKALPMRKKFNEIEKTLNEIEAAKNNMAGIQKSLDDLLARRYLGETVDTAPVELELRNASNLVSQLTASNQGIELARATLQRQLDLLTAEIVSEAGKVNELQYTALRSMVAEIAEKYEALTIQTKDAYLELIVACQGLDDLYPKKRSLAYTYTPRMDFPAPDLPEIEGFERVWDIQFLQIPLKETFKKNAAKAGIL